LLATTFRKLHSYALDDMFIVDSLEAVKCVDQRVPLHRQEMTPHSSDSVNINLQDDRTPQLAHDVLQSPAKLNSVCRQLFPDISPLQHVRSMTVSEKATQVNIIPYENMAPKKNTQPSYKLGNIYQRLFGQSFPNAHSAEADCMALLQIFHLKAAALIPWVDKNVKSFGGIRPMY